VPFSKIPYSVNCSDENNYLAREAARKSIVLLKNEGHTLPLRRDLKKIAVIGPNADNFEALLGNYNGIPKHPVTVLEGIRNKVEPGTVVSYAEGSNLAEGIHNLVPIPSRYLQTESGQQGVYGEYFDNAKLEGKPVFSRVDDQINFYWESYSPSPKLPDDNFSIRWTGYLVPPVTGTYSIGSWGMPTLNIYLEGKMILSRNTEHCANHNEKDFELQAGKRYKIVFEYKNWTGDADAKLLWSMPKPDMLNDAVKAAQNADAAVLVLGLSQRLEGEEMKIAVDGFLGGDRTHLNLPKDQQELMEAVNKTGKPVVLVLMNGSALSVNWAADHLDAILSAGYAGQEGGDAVADVLFGDYNPAGRLPVTYYKSVGQLPPFENYDMKGRTYRYFIGEPLYPFGFGLSYTTFSYSDLQIPKEIEAGKEVTATVKVTNTGNRAGEEVVQFYLTDEKASTPRPIRQLAGFDRISLQSDESKVVTFTIAPRQLSLINDKEQRVIEPGYFTVTVGGKQPGFTGRTDASTTGVVSGRFKVTGKVLKVD
jgi:beta-glucosidase